MWRLLGHPVVYHFCNLVHFHIQGIFVVTVGYSTCHWCHVMERESFEDEEIGKILSDNFVCIKVDREERPDVDKVYMTFVQVWFTLEIICSNLQCSSTGQYDTDILTNKATICFVICMTNLSVTLSVIWETDWMLNVIFWSNLFFDIFNIFLNPILILFTPPHQKTSERKYNEVKFFFFFLALYHSTVEFPFVIGQKVLINYNSTPQTVLLFKSQVYIHALLLMLLFL